MGYVHSIQGEKFILGAEGIRQYAYWDVNGWAIGYGNHRYENGAAVQRGDYIPAERALPILRAHVRREILDFLNSHVNDGKLNQHQVDAIVSLLYNAGAGVLTSTGLNNVVNKDANDVPGVTSCFSKIIYSDGKKKDFLVDRRDQELRLYFNGDYSASGKAYSGGRQFLNGLIGDVNDDINVPKKNYFIRYANDTTIKNLQDFIDYWKLKTTPEELLAFEDNSTVLYQHYRKNDREKYKSGGVKELVEYGTPLKIPNIANTVRSVFQLHQTIEKNEDFNAFLEAEVRRLLNNPKYKRLNISRADPVNGGVYKRNEYATVLIWSRALCPDESHLIDITEYLQNVNTNVGMNGGNFTMRLPKLTYDLTENANGSLNFKIRRLGKDNFVLKQQTHYVANANALKFAGYNKIDDNEYLHNSQGKYHKRTNNFFNDVLQTNDLVFITYEKLELDHEGGRGKAERTSTLINGIRYVDSSCLPDNIFTFIGLIDNVSSTNSNKGLDAEVSIAGRDYSKVLIDDTTQFFTVTYGLRNAGALINGLNQLGSDRFTFQIYKESNNVFQQNLTFISPMTLIDSQFNFFVPHSIEEFLVWIFSKLTHQPILDGDTLFKSYKHKSFIISSQEQTLKDASTNTDETYVSYKKVEASGIWKISKLIIDPKIANRMILDSDIANDTGSIINFVRKVCQMPFVQFFTDTYGDKFYYIVRKPPFTESSYKSLFTLNIYEDDVIDDSLTFCNEVYTYYQLNPLAAAIKDSTFMEFLPAVVLPEYMKIFGNKVMKVDSNYLDFDLNETSESEKFIDQCKKQHREDMDFLLETTAYLPFTRTGKITMKGEPRVKKGMNIRYMGTGELFHVEGVSQSLTFSSAGPQRNTILEVSHGIIEKEYDKYFKVINLHRTYGEANDVWRVNLPIFNYLMRKRTNQNP